MMDIMEENIDTYYTIYDLTENTEFTEFSKCIDELMAFNEDVFIERLVDQYSDVKRRASSGMTNAKKTTADTMKAYGAAVHITSSVMKTEWAIIAKCWGLIANALNFVADKMDKIPDALEHVTNRIAALPHEIVAKIRGDIKLYIQVADFKNIYSTGLIGKIEKFMSEYKATTTSTTFQTKKGFMKFVPGNKDDMNHIDALIGIGKSIEYLRFEPAIIRLDEPQNVQIYFQSAQSVQFEDNAGNNFKLSYLAALKKLVEDLKKSNKTIEDLRKTFGNKYSDSLVSDDFARLSAAQQNKVQKVMQASSRVIGNVGALIKCVLTDIKTIENALKKLEAASNQNK